MLDKTKTAMGARTLRKYVEQPLIDKTEIESRLDASTGIERTGHIIEKKSGNI